MGRESGGCIFKDKEETFGLVSEGRGIRQTGVKIPEMVTWKYFAGWQEKVVKTGCEGLECPTNGFGPHLLL